MNALLVDPVSLAYANQSGPRAVPIGLGLIVCIDREKSRDELLVESIPVRQQSKSIANVIFQRHSHLTTDIVDFFINPNYNSTNEVVKNGI